MRLPVLRGLRGRRILVNFRVDAGVAARLAEASALFEGGALRYSATRDGSHHDGLELRCVSWTVRPLEVEPVRSGYFEDALLLLPGSATFDCALLMSGVEHEWHAREELLATNSPGPQRLLHLHVPVDGEA